MPQYIDLTKQRFGRLLVKNRSGTHHLGGALFLCKCDCGKTIEVRAQSLRQGHTKSCGCFNSDQKRDICIERNTTHGLTGTRTYHIWENMLGRCLNKASTTYAKYGARGISVCERWRKFENFFNDMGECPLAHTLDRIDSRGNYEPNNCRWATMKEQQNNRLNNRHITYAGETLTLMQWAEKVGIKRETISRRLEMGWTIERALNEKPVLGRNQFG